MSPSEAITERNAGNRGRAVVVMPTYNERENLPDIVPAILGKSKMSGAIMAEAVWKVWQIRLTR